MKQGFRVSNKGKKVLLNPLATNVPSIEISDWLTEQTKY